MSDAKYWIVIFFVLSLLQFSDDFWWDLPSLLGVGKMQYFWLNWLMRSRLKPVAVPQFEYFAHNSGLGLCLLANVIFLMFHRSIFSIIFHSFLFLLFFGGGRRFLCGHNFLHTLTFLRCLFGPFSILFAIFLFPIRWTGAWPSQSTGTFFNDHIFGSGKWIAGAKVMHRFAWPFLGAGCAAHRCTFAFFLFYTQTSMALFCGRCGCPRLFIVQSNCGCVEGGIWTTLNNN